MSLVGCLFPTFFAAVWAGGGGMCTRFGCAISLCALRVAPHDRHSFCPRKRVSDDRTRWIGVLLHTLGDAQAFFFFFSDVAVVWCSSAPPQLASMAMTANLIWGGAEPAFGCNPFFNLKGLVLFFFFFILFFFFFPHP